MFNKTKTYTQQQVDMYLDRIEFLQKSIKEREDFLESVQRNASVVIDWENFNCISVERVKYDGESSKTILTGLRDGSTHDYTYFVSDEKHEEIAEQFRQYLANRK